jgi:uncharacterized protein (DUF58 family)
VSRGSSPSFYKIKNAADTPRLSWVRRFLPRTIRFTGQGKLYTAVTLGVGFAAVNTGNNLLFLVLGLLLGLIVVSGILSDVSLRGLEVKRRTASYADADTVFPVELSVKNMKRFASSFAVELRDEIDDVPFRRRCFFLRVAPTEERAIAYRCEIAERGVSRFTGIIVSTRFPFGLFEKSRFVQLIDEIVVLPKIVPCGMPETVSEDGKGVRPVKRLGQGQEFLELREMQEGDDPRRIDWRSSAKLNRRMVRENEVEGEDLVELILDPSAAVGQNPELNIARAGSLIRKLSAREIPVRLITSPTSVLESNGSSQCLKLLIHLALLDPAEAVSSPPPPGRPGAVLIGPRAKREKESSNFGSCRGSRP